jgi:hypothetical protein
MKKVMGACNNWMELCISVKIDSRARILKGEQNINVLTVIVNHRVERFGWFLFAPDTHKMNLHIQQNRIQAMI